MARIVVVRALHDPLESRLQAGYGAGPSTMEPTLVIEQALMCQAPSSELEQLHELGILQEVYPEVAAMVGFGGGSQGHKDLWDHTKKVVSQCPPQRALRWAALFHDVGKVPTFSREHGKVTFHGHEVASARLFDKAARRSGMEPEFRKLVRFLVRHLGHVESYECDWTDSAVRRLHRDVQPHLAALVELACADITTKHADKRARHQERMRELATRAAVIAEADNKPKALPKGLGMLIIEELAIEPGPQVGALMAGLKDAVERGELPGQAEPEIYLAYLRARDLGEGG